MTAASLDPGGPSRFPDEAQCRTELLIGGMTCGACANRVERTLNKIDGVSATVNYATEKASVSFCDPVTVRGPGRCRGAGRLHGGPARTTAPPADPHRDGAAPDPALVALRTRLLACLRSARP